MHVIELVDNNFRNSSRNPNPRCLKENSTEIIHVANSYFHVRKL